MAKKNEISLANRDLVRAQAISDFPALAEKNPGGPTVDGSDESAAALFYQQRPDGSLRGIYIEYRSRKVEGRTQWREYRL